MALTTIAGPVTGLRVDTTTTTQTTFTPQTGGSSVTSTQSSQMNFRVGNRPVYMKRTCNLNNGDIITAAGYDKSGELEVIAYKNHTTQMMYWVPAMPLWIFVIALLIGLMTLGVLVGYLIVAVAGYHLVVESAKKMKLKEAFALIKAAPVPAGV